MSKALNIILIFAMLAAAQPALAYSPAFIALGEPAPMGISELAAGLAAEKLVRTGRLGGRVLGYYALVSSLDISQTLGAVTDAYDQQVQDYDSNLWTYFLNDPLIMGPAPGSANRNYVRYVFEKAAEKVNGAFAKYMNGSYVSAKRIYISENFIPDYKVLKDPETKTKRAYFFIPSTPLLNGTLDEKINKVALELGGLVAELLNLSEASQMTSHYDDQGHPTSVLNPNKLHFYQATFLLSAQLLGLPAPDFTKTDYQIYLREMGQYKADFDKRSPLNEFPSSLADFEKRFLSFRKHRVATLAGPEMGTVIMNPCNMDGQEQVLARPIPACETIHLSDIDNNQQISSLVTRILAQGQKNKHNVKSGKLIGEAMVGLIIMGLTDIALTRAFGKLSLAGSWATKLTQGGLRIVANGFAFVVGQQGAKVLFRDKGREEQSVELDSSQLINALQMLQNNWMYINQFNYADLNGPNGGQNKTLRETLFSAFQTSDPAVMKVFEALIQKDDREMISRH